MNGTLIHTEDIFPFLEGELSHVQFDLTIVSAFVKVSALEKLDQELKHPSVQKRLLVRFRKEDILFGSSDIEIFNYCRRNDWKLYFNLDLHSKIFIFDKTRYVVGSANVTLSGLGIAKRSNIETVCSGMITMKEMHRINQFFDSSTELTEKIYLLMLNELSEKTTKTANEWDCDIIGNLEPPNQLWVSEIIFSLSPYDMNSRDRALLEIDLQKSWDMHLVKKKFMNSKCYRWLLHAIGEEIYFGELASKLHNSLIDDPTPYRKEVKQLLSNLLNWIIELRIEGIQIDRPHYSQRIKKLS